MCGNYDNYDYTDDEVVEVDNVVEPVVVDVEAERAVVAEASATVDAEYTKAVTENVPAAV